MTEAQEAEPHEQDLAERDLAERDLAPGDEALDGSGVAQGLRGYLVGLALAVGLTAASFYFARSPLIWAPGVATALMVLAIAQMGVHLVFFLHITTGPDNTNNVLALAFGVLIVFLILAGSIWIMANLNQHMPAQMPAMPPGQTPVMRM